MAKTAKPKAAPKPRGKAKAQAARPVIGQGKLRELMRMAKSVRTDTAEIRGEYGAAVKEAVDNHHLNRKVLRVLVDLERMSPENLKVFLEDLEHGLDISGLQQRADSVPAFDFKPESGKGEDGGEDGETEAVADKGTVRPFPRPHSVAAE